MKKLKRVKLLSLILISVFILTACNKNNAYPDYLGNINYQAENTWIENRSTETEELLEYREILDPEAFIQNSEVPVLVCIKQKDDYAAPKVIPWMESLAYKYKDKLNCIFIEDDPQNDYLYLFDYRVTPSFFLIKEHSIIASASWQEENALQKMNAEIQKLY